MLGAGTADAAELQRAGVGAAYRDGGAAGQRHGARGGWRLAKQSTQRRAAPATSAVRWAIGAAAGAAEQRRDVGAQGTCYHYQCGAPGRRRDRPAARGRAASAQQTSGTRPWLGLGGGAGPRCGGQAAWGSTKL
ncbi:shadow of prion protein-like [Sorghum bicolor]|jgi:hypothetical protein|uniref:shadow of prion protein-like n=1 Tax=Sorghum bicolor TaxID=4558 RepID=UPI000B42412E|nr:shadow of prion protein-like [Sorghum bicolor]|eukprot:XP_021318131.1 shadow of prion protein-like [Sorghum bicolor]